MVEFTKWGSPLVYAFLQKNIVLVDKTRSGDNVKLEIWGNVLKSKKFLIK